MHKTAIVARSEFATLVRSKAFIVSLILMPVVMVGSILAVRFTKDAADVSERRFAYVDRSGLLGPALEAAAKERAAAAELEGRTVARFVPVAVEPGDRSMEE